MGKITIIVLLSITVCFGQTPKTKQAKINAAYKIGMQALQEGDFAKAEKYLQAVVKASPTHGNAKYGLLELKKMRSTAKKTKSKSQLKGIMLPKIDLSDLTFNEAIEEFRLITDQANGKVRSAPNITIFDPDQKLADKIITISLENVPAESVLNYILDVAGARAKHGEYIIEIHPR